MAEEPKRSRKFNLVAILLWVGDKIIRNWKELAALFGGGGVTYIGRVTDAVKDWGAFHWALFFVALSLGIWTVLWAVSAVRAWALSRRARTRLDERALEHGSANPMRKQFQDERIYLNDFVLPSNPVVERKTFVDCDFIGPAIIYFQFGNKIDELRPPRCDAVYLHPGKDFFNGFVFRHCHFRGCSFQRVTVVVGDADYPDFESTQWLNWITLTPKDRAEPQLQLTAKPPASGGE
jgi:hypothetical protein